MYSAAFNNFDHISGSADPNTGTFSFMETIGPIQADGQFGPKCNLIMSYSLMATYRDSDQQPPTLTGLGRGWSFRLGNYSKSANTLTLYTGAAYTVLEEGSPWKLSHKLKDIRVEKIDGDDGSKLNIYHKNGDVEIMDIDSDTGDAILKRFTSANGHYLEFKHIPFLNYRRLTEVRDNQDHILATVNYGDEKTTIVTHPDTPEERTTTLRLNADGALRKIERSDDEFISFVYNEHTFDDNNKSLLLIQKINYSNGASEEAEYYKNLLLPVGAPIPYTPAISKHTKIIATDQPHVITNFTYGDDDHDYWGVYGSFDWENNKDGLFNSPLAYHYTSTTQCGDKTTTYKYNKFHQVLSTTETNGDDTKKIVTNKEYYSDQHVQFKEQSSIYELLKKETIEYQSSSDSQDYSKSYEYDDWGNVLVETNANGNVHTVSEYYPPQGGDGCPPHPHGMVAYVKQRSYVSSDGSLKKTFSYTYQSTPTVGGGSMIVPASKVYDKITKTYTYHDSHNTDPRILGSQKSEITTMNGKSFTKSTDYVFPDDNMIHMTETVTGYDRLSTSTSKTLSYWNGLVKQETDEAGVVTKYAHNNSGQIISMTTGADTDYKLETTYQYIRNPPDPSDPKSTCIGLKVIQETPSCATVHTFYDGDEKELMTYQKDEYEIPRKLSEKKYDKQARVVSHTQYDYVISEDDHNILKTFSEAVTIKYDTWGAKCETEHSDGTIDRTVRDPINNQITRQVVHVDDTGSVDNALHSTKTTFNFFGRPSKVEVFNKSGDLYSTTSFEYDKFGRKIKVTGTTGAVAEITQYDAVDRPIEFKHYDDTLFQISYTDVSVQSLVSSITATLPAIGMVPSMDVTLGHQDYDGLSRITSKTVNGVKTQFSYKDGYKTPSRRINGRGQTLLFDYIPELEMQPSRVASFSGDVQIGDWDNTSKVSESVYSYGKSNDTAFGLILSATSSAGQYSYEYSSLGALKTTKQVVGTHSQSITNEHTTMGMKPISVKIGDRKMTYNRNERGDITSIIDGDIMTEVSTDDFSRISKKVVKQYNSSSAAYDTLQTTETLYDDYSRETTRTITVKKSGKTVSILSSYDTDDKIIQRDVTINDTDSLSESYKYDHKKRLTDYEVSKYTTDTLLPRNENGKPFTSQTFAFDGLDNITSIVTRFPNGNTDTATLIYDQTNKQRLIRISHTLTTGGNAYPGCITLQYDADGNITSYKDSAMTYTVSGRLATKDDTVYSYDPFDRLVKSKDTVRMYSDHGHVVQELNDSGTTDFIRYGNIPVGEIQNGRKKIFGVDQSFTTVSVTEDTSTTAVTYSPYGHGDNGARIGLNGELRDIGDSNVYHLGNGIRTYFPSFNGFSTADSYSPFLGGGINPYKYCGGDPVNAIDSSGHFNVWKILGLVVSVIVALASTLAVPFTAGASLGLALGFLAGACGIVSATLALGSEIAKEEGKNTLAKTMSIVSLGFGIASAVFAVAQIGADIGYTIKAARIARAIEAETIEAESGGFVISTQTRDQFETTGFRKRYAFARQPMTEEEKKFYVRGRSRLPHDQITVSEKKWGRLPIYKRTIKVPYRVYRANGEYAGMSNILSKVGTGSRIITGLAKVANFFSTVSQLQNEVHLKDNGGGGGGGDSSPHHDGNAGEGSEPSITSHMFSAYGLPVYKPFDAAKLLFKY